MSIKYEKETGLLYKIVKDKKICIGGVVKNPRGKKYHSFYLNGKNVRTHQYIWEMHNGKIPSGLYIDHIDGDGTNNRLENLRLVTQGQNNKNRGINVNNQYGYKGVYFEKRFNLKNPWKVWIQSDGKVYTKSGFATPQDAARHYNQKALELHGEYARLNVIN
jgi:HNH endonuclease